MKPNFRHLPLEEISQFLQSINEPNYKVKQIQDWLWKNHTTSFDEMSNLSLRLRQQLKDNFSFLPLTIHSEHIAKDNTVKIIFRTWDNFFIEGVLISSQHRKTACISSQVGCSLDCSFCATGKLKRERNLTFDEIVDQFFLLEKRSLALYNQPLSNVVFMGMGEPLLNYRQVLQSITTITDPTYRGMSPRRITVSTAGIAKAIRQLGDDMVRFELAVSLHATNDIKRSQIMSINASNDIQSIISALNHFYKKTKSKITLEYLLLKGFNDSPQDMEELVHLYRQAPIKVVNFIQYNYVDGSAFKGTEEIELAAILVELQKNRVNARVRRSRGQDINAACGQLASKVAKS